MRSILAFQERHCSEVAFRQAKLKPANPVNPSAIPPPTNNGPPTTATGSIGYAPDAAWLAVRRHMQINSFDDLSVSLSSLLFS